LLRNIGEVNPRQPLKRSKIQQTKPKQRTKLRNKPNLAKTTSYKKNGLSAAFKLTYEPRCSTGDA
jgi:hypothetical protein